MKATQTVTTGTEAQRVTCSASALASSEAQILAPGTGRTEPAQPSTVHFESKRNALSASPDSAVAPLGSVLPLSVFRRSLRLAIGGIAPLSLLIYLGSGYFTYVRCWVKTDNAYLAAHVHSISSRVAGTVKEVL